MEEKKNDGALKMASLPSGVVDVMFFKSALHTALGDPGYLDLSVLFFPF